MSVVEDIEEALFARARDFTFAAAKKAWPNFKFVPPADGSAYLRIAHFPNEPARLFLKGSDPYWRRGFLQITVAAPLGNGALEATEIAGDICSHFPADLTMTVNTTTVRVTKAPTVMSGFSDDKSWLVPVTIYYEAFA